MEAVFGAETAYYFAEAGASRIAILGRRKQAFLDTKELIDCKFPGKDVFTATTDVTNKADVNAAFQGFAANINVLVNNAAMIGPQDPVREADPEKFLETVQSNLSGALFVA